MPHATNGFTATEAINHVVGFVGNKSTDFSNYVTNLLNLAQFRFCKLHDWGFLRKQGLSLAVYNGTAEYTLTSATIGFEMPAECVETIYSPSGSIVLARNELKNIRRQDPEGNDGNSNTYAQIWAPVGDNKILFWPPSFKTTTLKIDGKILPSNWTGAGYPTVPYRYQESLLEYIIALALDRENDDRAAQKKQDAMGMIRQDIEEDMRNLGSTLYPRIKSMKEAQLDGIGANLEAILFGLVTLYE